MLYIRDIQREGFRGLFTADEISKGDVVLELDIFNTVDSPTQTSIQIGSSSHVEDDLGKYINHSCKPNVYLDRKTLCFIAAVDIPAREEITFDYTSNEDTISFPFICKCCGKFIK